MDLFAALVVMEEISHEFVHGFEPAELLDCVDLIQRNHSLDAHRHVYIILLLLQPEPRSKQTSADAVEDFQNTR